MTEQENELSINKLPRYNGNFENWPRFRSHFDAFICTRYKDDQMVTLRNALKDNDALEQLKSDTLNDGVLRALLIRTCTDQAEFIITDYESGADAWR